MIVVSNTTPLIGLASIGRFELLRLLFGVIHIAPAVYDEAVTAGRKLGGAKQEVSTATWIRIIPIQQPQKGEPWLEDMDLGEVETILLAEQLAANWVLMDEKKGRRKVMQMGLSPIGTAGILLKAKQVGLLAFVRPELEALRERGFSISQTVVDAVSSQAGES
jgi:uncharacterized protein